MSSATIRPGDTVRIRPGIYHPAAADFVNTPLYVLYLRGTAKASVSNTQKSYIMDIDQLEKVAAPPSTFAKGEKVKVVLNQSGHGFRLGSTVTVAEHRQVGRDGGYYLCRDAKGNQYKVIESDLRKLHA